MWKSMDAVEGPPCFLRDVDLKSCVYARDYISRGGFKASEANGLVSNLKKGIATKGTSQWYWKERAVEQFASELLSLFGTSPQPFHLVPIPSSKRRDDPEYDPRLDMVVRQVCSRRPAVLSSCPITRVSSRIAAHLSSSRPTIDEIYGSLEWAGVETPPCNVVLVDDVITTGASFRACERLILENAPECDVYGVFWARTVWPDHSVDIDFESIT